MKIARVLPAGLLLALVVGGQSTWADGWSLGKLNPFAQTNTTQVPPRPGNERYRESTALGQFNEAIQRRIDSDVKKIGHGTKKLLANADAGTRKLLAGARDMLPWSKAISRTRPTNQYGPWIREPQQYARPQEKKESWFSTLFRREEPKRVDSLKDWVGLPRPEL